MSFLRGAHTMCHPSEAADMAEVDVTPVMNMFIILIPFLVSMAVFTQLSVLSFSLPPNVGQGLDQSGGKPKVKMTVVVGPGYLAVTHGDKMLDSIPVTESGYNFGLLGTALATRRPEIEIQDEVIIAVRDEIQFKNVVTTMDVCKEQGFTKIGVSNATGNAEKGI